MRLRITSVLGYTAAVATLLAALLVPFVLMGGIESAFARAGFRIDPVYSGGNALRTIHNAGYTVTVYEPVFPHWLQRGKPFQQVVIAPATALPAHVDQTIDLNGDGKADVRVLFDLPSDPNAPLHGTVEALNAKYRSVANLSNNSFTEMLVRADGRILLRVPLADKN